MEEAAMRDPIRVPGLASSATERWAVRLALALSLGGAAVAAYLVRLHAVVAGNPKGGVCTFTETISCDKVLASPYAAIDSMPVALIGLLGFLLLFGMALWRAIGQGRTPNWLPLALMLTAGLGLAFEVVMTWVELFVIQAACPYCLTALALIAGTFAATTLAWRAAGGASPTEDCHA